MSTDKKLLENESQSSCLGDVMCCSFSIAHNVGYKVFLTKFDYESKLYR